MSSALDAMVKKFRFYFKLNGIPLGVLKIHSRNIVKTNLMVTIISIAGSDLRVDYIASLIKSIIHSFINLSAQKKSLEHYCQLDTLLNTNNAITNGISKTPLLPLQSL